MGLPGYNGEAGLSHLLNHMVELWIEGKTLTASIYFDTVTELHASLKEEA